MAVFKRSRRDKKTGVVKKSNRWLISFRDHRKLERWVTAFENKAASAEVERKLRKLIDYIIAGLEFDQELLDFLAICPFRDKLVAWGIIPNLWAELDRPILEHITDWAKSLGHNTRAHVKEARDKVVRISVDCGWKLVTHISPDDFAEWREARLQGADALNVPQVDDKGNPSPKAVQLSTVTLKHYETRFKAFCAWLVKKGRLHKNPLAQMELRKVKRVKVRPRAPFSPAEVEAIIAAAMVGKKQFGMEGRERALLYPLVYRTGLRWMETKSLIRESFNLEANPPYVTISAEAAKNGDEADLPLPPELVEVFKEHLETIPEGGAVFGGGSRQGKGAAMLRVDMKAAGVAEKDHKGRIRDFHALRHSYATILAKSGVPLPMAQKMMRHSDPKLTSEFYIHADVGDMAEELAKLPKIRLPAKPKGEAKVIPARPKRQKAG